MITDLQRNRLNKIIGMPFSYKGKNIKIERFNTVASGNTVIHENGKVLCNLLPKEIDDFLSDLKPPIEKEAFTPSVTNQNNEVPATNNDLATYQPTQENKEVKETLLETLRKVKEDPAFIPQATAICDVVGQIVNVQKTEIQMLNILNKRKS